MTDNTQVAKDIKKLNSNKFFLGLRSYLIITLGLFIYCFGICTFFVPNNLVGGGVSGVSAILYYASHGKISMGLTYVLINVVLILIAIKVLGLGFGWKTIYAILLISLLLDQLPRLMPEQFIREFSLDNGKILCAVLGSVCTGFGIGASMSQGGSSGGTDIVALLVNKYRNISPGKVILFIDVVIILSVLFCPSYNAEGELIPLSGRIATAAYGFILITVNSYVVDLYLSGSKQSVQLFIFSEKPEEMADVMVKMRRGVTVIPAKGWYTKSERDIVMVIAHKSELNNLLRIVKTVDPDAFLSVSTVMGVYGKGFDQLKGKAMK